MAQFDSPCRLLSVGAVNRNAGRWLFGALERMAVLVSLHLVVLDLIIHLYPTVNEIISGKYPSNNIARYASLTPFLCHHVDSTSNHFSTILFANSA